jgi:hypothetical protein
MLDFRLRSVQRQVFAVAWPTCGWLGTLQVSVASLWVVGYITDWYQSYRLKHRASMGQICWSGSYG